MVADKANLENDVSYLILLSFYCYVEFLLVAKFMYSALSTQIFNAVGADWFRSWMYLNVSVTALDI
jgi:hypothetical protein